MICQSTVSITYFRQRLSPCFQVIVVFFLFLCKSMIELLLKLGFQDINLCFLLVHLSSSTPKFLACPDRAHECIVCVRLVCRA